VPISFSDGRSFVGKAYELMGINKLVLPILLSSLSSGTWKQYETCYKRWFAYCISNNTSPYKVEVDNVLLFLKKTFDSGVQYGTINSYRSAMALIANRNQDLGNDNMVRRFLKGCSKQRPAKAKYDCTWDPTVVIDMLNSWAPLSELSLHDLSLKTVTLLALATAHRVQTFASIKLQNIKSNDSKIEIFISEQIKTSGPGRFQPYLILPRFLDQKNICAARALEEYISRTEKLRDSDFLFIGIAKPHKPVGSQTISRWIRTTLQKAGIDTSIFGAHSCRHASTSAAKRAGISVDEIRSRAGWSKSSNVFAKFYDRPCHAGQNFAQAVFSTK